MIPVLAALILAQYVPTHAFPASGGGGGGSPTFVSAGSDFTGGGSLAISVTAGNRLVVWTVANDRTTGHTCSGGGNTYVIDGANVLGTGSTAIVGNLMHVATVASTATITISCTGTTPLVAAIQYSGGTGALDTASSGTNPSSATGSSSPLTPAAFTPTTAATILVDGYGDLGGGTVTLAQVDTNYTTQGSCLTGATCFIGAIGTRVVSSSASYSDGYSFTGSGSGSISINAAYK
jgi:hypothetical protein